MSQEARRRRLALGIAVAFEGGLLLLAWPLGWLLRQPPLATLHLGVRDAALGAAASVPMIAAGLALARRPVGPLARIKTFFDEAVKPFFAPLTVADLAFISVVAGVGEEVLVRGVVQGALAAWLGRWPGLALASLLFGLLHAITATYVVLAALAGAYLGLVWLLTGNLLAPIVAHALYDFVLLVYLLRPRSPSGRG
jgi:membrane protease YdiL (CAAX protease family)